MKKYKIAVIGLGYVGLPLALSFSGKKNSLVFGFDIDKNKTTKLQKGHSYIKHISNSKIRKRINKNFFVYNSFEKIKEVDFIALCLPTPISANKIGAKKFTNVPNPLSI